MTEVKIYNTYLCTLPDAAAVDMAFALAYVWFHRTGSFADVTATQTRTKKVYKPSDEIRSGLQISIENWHSSCNINK